MVVTSETSHFEMSELNASVRENTAESKQEKREKGAKRRSERMSETNRGHFRRKKEEEKRKKKKGKDFVERRSR